MGQGEAGVGNIISFQKAFFDNFNALDGEYQKAQKVFVRPEAFLAATGTINWTRIDRREWGYNTGDHDVKARSLCAKVHRDLENLANEAAKKNSEQLCVFICQPLDVRVHLSETSEPGQFYVEARATMSVLFFPCLTKSDKEASI